MAEEPKENQEAAPSPASAPVDSALLERAKGASDIPLPDEEPSWALTTVGKSAGKKRLFGLLKSKELNYETMADLRKASIMSPGNTMIEVQRLRKIYPSEPSLLMLSATCSSGMMLNSSSKKGILEGLKSACKDAGGALMADGISLYNIDAFLNIYFNYLSRLKREQATVYKLVQADHRLDSEKKKLTKSISTVEYLLGEKSKNQAIIGHLKKKLKSSTYTTIWGFSEIRAAIKAVEGGRNKEETPIGSSLEMVSHLYAVLIALSRVPIAAPIVDTLLEMFPDANISLFLRKRSVIGIRRVTAMKTAQAQGDRNNLAKHATTMFKECGMVISKIEGQAIKQSFEAEPYLNVALAVQMTAGLLHPEEQVQRLEYALKIMQSLIKLDMSKSHKYTEIAKAHTHSLNNMIDTFREVSEGNPEASSDSEKNSSDEE